jgi:hypothetical protein
MANADPVKRVTRAVQALQNVTDPMARLDRVRWAREVLEALESATVRTARASGATWKDIGVIYGMTKQGAQQRFGAAAADPETLGTVVSAGPQLFHTTADASAQRRR